ncbi:MAG: cation:proton antiporter, partial [candidate division NC10 bacterium]|nr:cation:proton antiporter [candidate division NC10 bacterium]
PAEVRKVCWTRNVPFGWSWKAAQICGVALSTTSLAVVYAVLVETGLTHTTLGKIIMPRLQPWFFPRYGGRVIEPEIKGAFAALLVLMYFADRAESHAVLPAFILGLAVAKIFHAHREEQRRFRVVAFALLTPFFFVKSGMNVSLRAVGANLGLMLGLLGIKLLTKAVAVYPPARRYLPQGATYTTLLMSTGLTFGTISSLYGLNAGILTKDQFSVLVTVVVLSAVVPTWIAQRFFHPAPEAGERREGALATASTMRERRVHLAAQEE